MIGWLRKRGIKGATETSLALRAVAIDADPFRGTPTPEAELPPVRSAQPRTLDEVIEALRAADMSPRRLRRGFEVAGTAPDKLLRGFVGDVRTVTPESIAIVTNEAERAIDVGHALVGIFGPIAVDFGDAGWIVIDGTRTIDSLRGELSDRYKTMMRQMAAMMEELFAELREPLQMPSRRRE